MSQNRPDSTGSSAPTPTASTLRFQGAANRIVRVLLATPGLSRLIGRRLVTLYVVGRSSGRTFVLPVAYTPYQGDLLIGSPFRWVRNLSTGTPIRIRYKGRRGTAQVRSSPARQR